MRGFGNSPFGNFSFGSGLPDEAPDLSGQTNAARYIDSTSKDFVADSKGALLDMPVLRQRVLLALTTTLGSAAASPKLGLDISKIRKITPQFEAQVKAKINVALYQMTNNEKVIKVSSIVLSVGSSGRVKILVNYIDLTTQLPDSVST